jgi:hypothetical protein
MSLADDWTVTGIVQWGSILVVGGFVLSVLCESNVRNFIEERGWDRLLSRAVGKMQPFRERKGFWFAFGLVVGAAIVAWTAPYIGLSPQQVIPLGPIATSLRLQFYGDSRIPTPITPVENIHFWYAQFSPSIGIKYYDKDGNEIVPPTGSPKYGPSWNLFVTLEKPTKWSRISVSFSNPEKMGPSEIVGETDRSFIFHSFMEMPAGVLELRAIP